MEIEPPINEEKKIFELVKKDEIENKNERTSNEKDNAKTIFKLLYFWSIFILSTSFFADLIIYFCFYQEKNNQLSYNSITFFLRIITDALFISPLLLYIRYAMNSTAKNYLIGIFIILPQFILSLISIMQIFKQEFKTKEDLEIIDNKSNFLVMFSSNNTNNTTIDTQLSKERVTVLKISPVINLIIYLLSVVLTFLKIVKKF